MIDDKRPKRLIHIAMELQIGMNEIYDFLNKNNIDFEVSPNFNISHDVYTLLHNHFVESKSSNSHIHIGNNKLSHMSIIHLGIIKFYDAVKDFGYITNMLDGEEYYFSLNHSSRPFTLGNRTNGLSLNSQSLNTNDAVSFNLTQVLHRGRTVYNAVRVTALSALSNVEQKALIAIITAKFNQNTLIKFRDFNICKAIQLFEIWLIRCMRSMYSEYDYELVNLLLKYYKLNLCANKQETQIEDKISRICLFAPVKYQYQLWIVRWISLSALSDSIILEYIRHGLSIEQCLNMLNKEQATRIYQLCIKECIDSDYIRLLNIWSRRFGLHYDEYIEVLLLNKIKECYTNDQLYQLALNGSWVLFTVISKSYFTEGQFRLSDLEKIYSNIDLSNEEKIEMICKTEGLLVDKIQLLSKHGLLNNQLLEKLSVTDIEKLNLWKMGIIDRPFTIKEIYNIVAECDNATFYIDSLKDIITDSEYDEICFRYIQNHDLLSKKDLEWVYPRFKNWFDDENINYSQCLNPNTATILRMVKWVRSNSCQGYNHDFCRLFHLMSDSDQADYLRKIIELHRVGEIRLTTKYLLNLLNNKSDINLNVYVVIKILCKLKQENRFLYNREMFEIMHEIMPNCNNGYKLFSLSSENDLFERCKNRVFVPEIPSRYNLNEAKFKVAIDLNQKTSVINLREKDYWMYTGKLKNDIKTIKYNSQNKTWTATASEYENVKSFAMRNNDVIINLLKDGKLFSYNSIRYFRSYCPTFPERKVWKKPKYERIKVYKEFCDCDIYWCFGSHCINNCLVLHTQGEYNQYTLYDFINILKLSTNASEPIEYELTKFYTSLNWFERAIKHFYCRECREILEPADDGHHFNAHFITDFKCKNKECKEYNKKHYINHCFTEWCNNIIDDRDAKRCPNGRVICIKCGVCCSIKQFKNKIKIGPISLPQKELHLEQKRFFCPYCGAELIDNDNILYCKNRSDYTLKLPLHLCKTIILYCKNHYNYTLEIHREWQYLRRNEHAES